jgi:nitroreductase
MGAVRKRGEVMSTVVSKDSKVEKELPISEDWNEVERVILERRSVRIYKEKQVPEALVRRILEAGRYAPSAGNYQPWSFVVVRDKEIIDEMEKDARMMCKMFKFMFAWETSPLGPISKYMAKVSAWMLPNMMHPMPFAAISFIADGTLTLFHGAPTVILLLKDKRGAGKPEVDLGICGQNMVLAAHSLGLGTCWVGFVELLRRNPKWKKRLGISYPYEMCEGIALGYPVGKPDGMVPREAHQSRWYENGSMKIVS